MDARETLLNLLDQRVFLPTIHAIQFPDAHDRIVLQRVRRSVIETRRRYHEEYTSAESVKANFRSDLASLSGRNLATDMWLLKLPTFEDVKEEFFDICRSHGVGNGA
jgi:hypothetical protein